MVDHTISGSAGPAPAAPPPYSRGSWVVDKCRSGIPHLCLVLSCERPERQAVNGHFPWRVVWRTLDGRQHSAPVNDEGRDPWGRVYPPGLEPVDGSPSTAGQARFARSCATDALLRLGRAYVEADDDEGRVLTRLVVELVDAADEYSNALAGPVYPHRDRPVDGTPTADQAAWHLQQAEDALLARIGWNGGA